MTVADLRLMHRWANEPHVLRWWHEGGSLEQVRANYLPMIEGADPTWPLIAEVDGQPLGHAQWCRWGDYPDEAARFDADPDEYCVDYLLGVESRCGQGVGTALVAALLDRVRDSVGDGATGFLVDVDAANVASCRVLEKNGFRQQPDPHPERAEGSAPGRSVISWGSRSSFRPSLTCPW